MPREMDDNVLSQLYEVLTDSGFAGLAEAMTSLLNEVMRIERSHFLQAQPYERTEMRRGRIICILTHLVDGLSLLFGYGIFSQK